MLVCPQCQSENPNTNKFCEKCGTSLTHKHCFQCNAEVPLNSESCQNCGALTGTLWWAIISKQAKQPSLTSEKQVAPSDLTTSVPSLSTAAPHDNSVEALASMSVTPLVEDSVKEGEPQPISSASMPETPHDATSETASAPVSPSVEYLDAQQRYRLLASSPPEQTASGDLQVKVLDCQPFQKSFLEVFMEQQHSSFERLDTLTNPTNAGEREFWNSVGVPAIAQPYLSLQNTFYETLPTIHDAWQQDGEAVLLLQDRSQLPLLLDFWKSDQVPMLQILCWLDEMARLWVALEPWQMGQSLLEVNNLRVDEDQTLILQRLYANLNDTPLTLQDLGKMWQTLFYQSQRTQFSSMALLFRDLGNGDIEAIAQLRLRLEAIAEELEVQEQAAASTLAQSTISVTLDPTAPTVDQEADPLEAVTASPSEQEDIPTESNESDDMPTVILPMQLISLDDAGCTDIGRQREHNEDFFGIQTQVKRQENPIERTVQARGLYIICDGMGGHAGGEVASAMAVETLKQYFERNWHDTLPTEENIREAVLLANDAIYSTNQKNARSGSGRMGTTLVMALVQETKIAITHVGDSRLYRVTRKRGLEQVTTDHEVGQREMQRGVEEAIAYSRPDAYQLTQALGPRDENYVHPDIQFFDLNEDTLLVLCSDGLTDNDLLENHWQTHLAPLLSSRANLDQGVMQLIELANQHNGHDNITAVVVRAKVRPNFDQQQPL